ncbi:NADAR family protein [Streptomyces sp. NPDC059385]|uniref:NADAR family protein n=1 Tax=Streptomyces sp. NPDC059385 TaxID=3346817 RepID=UPI0036B2859C
MTWHGPTFRISDGERVDGAWCLVWRKDEWLDAHHPEHLFVYADGRITRGKYEATDLAGLAKLLASGKIGLTPPGTPPWSAPDPKWESRYPEPLTAESFLVEVADEITRLAGRPTAADRCWEAVRAYRTQPTEERRALLRDAYLAVPAHNRVYVLGDMDLQDRPLRTLLTDLGQAVDGDGPVATEEMHDRARAYFADLFDGEAAAKERRAVLYADEPAAAPEPPVVLCEVVYPNGWPVEPGPFTLRNDFDAPIDHRGRTYPTVAHAYWALSAADPADHDRVLACPTAREAQDTGGRAPRRADWPGVRLAVMAALLRAKFDQHPRLAEVLLATGEAGILYTGFSDAPFWRDEGPNGGRNWMGRLLELIRSELRAAVHEVSS